MERPNEDIPHADIVDRVVADYPKAYGKPLRDPDRMIRSLSQEGKLLKIAKGVYRYDPEYQKRNELENFTPADKATIMERDGYKCVVCGFGVAEGVELHVDHIKPKDLGGKATLENGQILCGRHNYMKKNFKQTETGKRMFISLLRLAQKDDNQELVKFCESILTIYDEHGINGHIRWK
ncbi:MAG: HNH endonuclease [Candidatus Pacebacteria bacterium]|nr:HNH endonuclease [Candidatus Paceibacterota bacterium]